MSEYHEILQGFAVEELHTTEEHRQALRACAELLLTTSEDFATATTLAMLLLANQPEAFTPSEDFLEQHPDNHPREYSSPAGYMAFFLLYLAEKARSAKDIAGEAATCTHYSTSCTGDLNLCNKCADRAEIVIPISQMRYEDIPPYHLGCRCKPILIQARE
jgi:hypothetical protein